MSKCKTERECVDELIVMAEKAGYKNLEECIAKGEKLVPGDKVYANNRNRFIVLVQIGEEDLSTGLRLLGAHIDSPRLDLKQSPLYEDGGFCFAKTHYYGGVRKYQWVAMPLALHGTFVKKDGTNVDIKIGDEAGDPVFYINDLLPHLGQEQSKRPLAEGITGEQLNILIGSRPFSKDEGSDKVKLNIIKILNEKYGITEGDFLSAELEVVPAFGADDIGFDRSLIGAYGHDDRVCAYPALMAILDCDQPEYTAVTVLTDKEETGSEGNTGLDSKYLEYFQIKLSEGEYFKEEDYLYENDCIPVLMGGCIRPCN